MQRIVLNKQTKTIKVVNRKQNISLKKLIGNITLTQTGRRGPQGLQGEKGDQGDKGDKGDTGESTMMRVVHGTNPNILHPDAMYVEWVGSVEPLNATPDDTWVKTL